MTKYKVLEKPHVSFPYDIGKIFESQHDNYEWTTFVGTILTLRVNLKKSSYFEEVVEKDYKILSLIYSGDSKVNIGRILKDEDNIKCWLNGASKEFWSIHSIKRLSDGEVFTVGDRVKYRLSEIKRTIKSFCIKKDELIITADRKFDSFDYTINNIVHTKQPLFTTEDGVDIYEGDKTTSVWKYSFNIHMTNTLNSGMSDNLLYFSTKEKAEEWIDNNKLIYSKEDIRKLLEEARISKTGYCYIPLLEKRLNL